MRWLALVLLAGCSSVFGFENAVVGDGGNELPSISFVSSSTLTDESAGSISIPIQLSTPAPTDVVVSFAVVGGIASLGADFELVPSSTSSIPAGETTGQLGIEIANDGLEEPDENIELVLSLVEGAVLGQPTTHQITIASNILPRASLMSPTLATDEGDAASLAVVLDLPCSGPCSVTLGVAGSAAAADIGLLDGTVVEFPPGVQSVTVPLDVVDDALDELDETVEVTLQSPTGDLLIGATATATHTIRDDDLPPTVAFAATTSNAGEAAATAQVVVSLSTVSGLPVTVQYLRLTDSADDTEAAVVGESLAFAPGETSKTITVTLVDDLLDEDDETVILALATPTNATIGGQSTHTLTLGDNDALPSVSWANATMQVTEGNTTVNVAMKLSVPSGRTVMVPLSVSGSANPGNDFTLGTASPVVFPAGTTTVNVVVDVNEDTQHEPNETVRLSIGSPTNATVGQNDMTLTIVDDD